MNHPLARRRRWLGRASVAGPGVLVVAAVATLMLALRRLEIVGESMRPTLEPGDRLLVLQFVRPRVGDLVALPDPRRADRMMVKRVAAVEGATVTVLGDNCHASTDSRHFGPVARRLVSGRVVYRYAPESRRGRVGHRARLP